MRRLTLRSASVTYAAMSQISALLPAGLATAYERACDVLAKADWLGIEGEIARTGEEDPLANVDDPDLAAVIAAKMAERHRALKTYQREPVEVALSEALDIAETALVCARAGGDGEAALAAIAAIAALDAPVEAFFAQLALDGIASDQQRGRFGLLERFVAAMHNATGHKDTGTGGH